MLRQFFRLSGVILASVLGNAAIAADDTAEDPLAAKAKALFAYEEGVWDSRWERLDADGNVVSEFNGTEVFSYTLDETALYLETRVEGRESWSRAIKFYSPLEKKIIFIDVDTNGDYWMMSQDVESGTVESRPTPRPNGGAAMIRFTVVRKTENEQDVVMDFSGDNGETWHRRSRQYMRRKVDE